MSGAGDRALAELLGGEPGAGPHIAAADNPTPLRWDLNEVLWGDTVTVLLPGPNSEPYGLELDPERAAVFRDELISPEARRRGASPSRAPGHAVTTTTTIRTSGRTNRTSGAPATASTRTCLGESSTAHPHHTRRPPALMTRAACSDRTRPTWR